jgi:hypothetical protein
LGRSNSTYLSDPSHILGVHWGIVWMLINNKTLSDVIEKSVLTKGYFIWFGFDRSESIKTVMSEIKSKFSHKIGINLIIFNNPKIILDLTRISNIDVCKNFSIPKEDNVEIFIDNRRPSLFGIPKSELVRSSQFKKFCETNNRYDWLLKLK